MPGYYTYFIASLPVLQFAAKPPFSSEVFIEMAAGIIPERDIELLKSVISQSAYLCGQPTLNKWLEFDTSLRNELVKIRAGRKRVDPEKFLRGDIFAEPEVSRAAMSAHRSASILDGEMILDRARWQALDELTIGHYFDLDFLIIYALKLLILERWAGIREADSEKLIEDSLRN